MIYTYEIPAYGFHKNALSRVRFPVEWADDPLQMLSVRNQNFSVQAAKQILCLYTSQEVFRLPEEERILIRKIMRDLGFFPDAQLDLHVRRDLHNWFSTLFEAVNQSLEADRESRSTTLTDPFPDVPAGIYWVEWDGDVVLAKHYAETQVSCRGQEGDLSYHWVAWAGFTEFPISPNKLLRECVPRADIRNIGEGGALELILTGRATISSEGIVAT